jgi:hypothetical protein
VVARLLDDRTTSPIDIKAIQDVVGSAVRQAMRSQSEDLRTEISTTVAGLRRELEAVRRSQDEHAAGLQSSLDAAAAASTGLPADISRRDAANRKSLRLTLHEEFMPLVEVVAESIAQTDHQLEGIEAKLEQLNELGHSLSATLDEVVEAVAELVVLELDADGTPAPPPPPRSPIAALRPAAERPRTGAAQIESPGNRVSLRRHPPGR